MQYAYRMKGDIITGLLTPLIFFEHECADKVTLRKLIALANDESRRKNAHQLFQEIRAKTLAAERRGDDLALTQYAFEEVCAKTLYNITGEPAPFDPDSPFWVLPLAVKLGKMYGVTDLGLISPLLTAD
jgi:hypothetical protein